MKKYIVFIILFSLIFPQNTKRSSLDFLKNIQSKDFYIGIYFGLSSNIYSVPIITSDYRQIKVKQVLEEVKYFDEYKESPDYSYDVFYDYRDGILKESYIYDIENDKMLFKRCKWIVNGKIECNENNNLIIDHRGKENIKEIYDIQPSKNKIIIKRFIKLGLIEEITLQFNSDFMLQSIKKEAFPETIETYDDNDSKKYLLIMPHSELIKVNFNRSYFTGNLKSISQRTAFYKKDSLMKSSAFKSFSINGNLVSNISEIVELETFDFKIGGGGSEIKFKDSITKSIKIERTSSYSYHPSKSRSSEYYSYIR